MGSRAQQADAQSRGVRATPGARGAVWCGSAGRAAWRAQGRERVERRWGWPGGVALGNGSAS